MRPGRDLIHRRGRRNVERGVIRVSPGKIGRLLGHDNGSEVMTGRDPKPIFHVGPTTYRFPWRSTFIPSGTPSFRSAWLDAKDAPVAQPAVVKVINTNILLLRVVYVKLCAVGGKGEPVGFIKIFGKQLNLAVGTPMR